LLSIVQALALEVLWSSIRDHDFLWEGGLQAAVGWMQVGISFQGIVVVWVAYLGLVVRFVWTPRILDMVIPFVLGIFQFVIASALEPQWLAYWLVLLAAMFVFATISNSSVFFAASELEENREHFELRGAQRGLYGTFSLYGPLAVFVGLILGSAILVARYGPTSVATLIALALTNLVLVVQFLQIRFYWNLALFAPVEKI
jgi:hypothetical protein